MKKYVSAVLLAIATTAPGENTAQMMERAHFLDTAKGQTEEAMVIYQQIAASKPTPENRKLILQALEKITAYQQNMLRKESTLQQKLDRFTMPTVDGYVIEILGTPDSNELLSKLSTLKNRKLTYADGYTVHAGTGTLYLNFKKPVHQINGVGVGSTEEELLTAFPPGERRVYDSEQFKKEGLSDIRYGTLYDKPEKPGEKWYPVNKELSFTLKDGKVESFTISRRSYLEK